MSPLHEALVEVHKEYAKASRAAKDMADMYRKSEQLRETEEIMKKINEEVVRRPNESVQEWQQKCQQAEEALKQAEEKTVLLEE